MRLISMVCALVIALLLSGCAGTPSRETPVEIFGDMAHQPKYKSQSASRFFPNGMANQGPVAGTVAVGHYAPEDVMATGVADGQYVGRMPIDVNPAVLRQGQAKFNTYCSPCHSRVGDGRGIVGTRSGWIASSLVDQRAMDMADGYLYHVITAGVRSMPAYNTQISVADRWAIVSYVRVLQKAHNGTSEDVPADMKGRLE
jgi:mono/diheme cytochrome c family protein